MVKKITPELKLLATIFEGIEPDKCEVLLHLRNKLYFKPFKDFISDKEYEYLTDLIIDLCQNEGYITWSEEKQTFVRNSDGREISKI